MTIVGFVELLFANFTLSFLIGLTIFMLLILKIVSLLNSFSGIIVVALGVLLIKYFVKIPWPKLLMKKTLDKKSPEVDLKPLRKH